MKLGFYHYTCDACGSYNVTCLDENEPRPIRHRCLECGHKNHPRWTRLVRPGDKDQPALRSISGIDPDNSPHVWQKPIAHDSSKPGQVKVLG